MGKLKGSGDYHLVVVAMQCLKEFPMPNLQLENLDSRYIYHWNIIISISFSSHKSRRQKPLCLKRLMDFSITLLKMESVWGLKEKILSLSGTGCTKPVLQLFGKIPLSWYIWVRIGESFLNFKHFEKSFVSAWQLTISWSKGKTFCWIIHEIDCKKLITNNSVFGLEDEITPSSVIRGENDVLEKFREMFLVRQDTRKIFCLWN